MTEKEEQRLNEQVDLDLKFQENLQFYDKKALAHLIAHIGQCKSTREWMLEVLESIQDIGNALSVYNNPTMQVKVIHAVQKKIDAIVAEKGPANLNTYSIEEFTEMILSKAVQTDTQAGYSNNLGALNGLIEIAALAIYGVTHHLNKNPEACQVTNRSELLAVSSDPKKIAGPEATEPANNNRSQKL